MPGSPRLGATLCAVLSSPALSRRAASLVGPRSRFSSSPLQVAARLSSPLPLSDAARLHADLIVLMRSSLVAAATPLLAATPLSLRRRSSSLFAPFLFAASALSSLCPITPLFAVLCRSRFGRYLFGMAPLFAFQRPFLLLLAFFRPRVTFMRGNQQRYSTCACDRVVDGLWCMDPLAHVRAHPLHMRHRIFLCLWSVCTLGPRSAAAQTFGRQYHCIY